MMSSKSRWAGAKLALRGATIVAAFALLTAAPASATSTYHWYGGGTLLGSSPTQTTGSGEGAFTTGWSVGGSKFEASCTKADLAGEVANPVGGGAGQLSNGTFNMQGCSVVYPPNKGCQIGTVTAGKFESGVIRFFTLAGVATESTGAGPGIWYAPASGTKFVTYNVRNCIVAGYNGDWSYTGLMGAAAVAGEPGAYRFSSSSESLVLGGNHAYVTGKYKLSTQGAGATVTVAP